VLQALTPAHWDETSDIRRCVSALSVLGPVSADPEGRR
jgi:hypothetical protein